MKKNGIFLVLALFSAEIRAIDPFQFLIGTGCFIGSFVTGTQCYKAIEQTAKGNAKIISKRSKEITVDKYYKKYIAKNASFSDELYYLRIRYGSSLCWGIATAGLWLAGGLFLKESLKEDLALNFTARFSASKEILK